ncbi:hypothetical protein SOASR030_02820 [Leminorella grimontii]|uniref:Uncharacterized protein n=1 Tax=Leminorella grimontii TaxID=82981 RepID=A0AAV5MXX6_9GAMM|nr:hypothetical protein SOASR030_02820 [Leminorella grimontii]
MPALTVNAITIGEHEAVRGMGLYTTDLNITNCYLLILFFERRRLRFFQYINN